MGVHILLAFHASDDLGRFGEIQEAVSGISNRVLSGRPADLESITYRLTSLGQQRAKEPARGSADPLDR
ncbi:hypothetical protein [Saccharopolyspora shandongensis]|uniref:hypothetical protein n=1 Tax=Saccharopolyspora shandongensis TaxID=418495 RepID=UPI0033D9AC04